MSRVRRAYATDGENHYLLESYDDEGEVKARLSLLLGRWEDAVTASGPNETEAHWNVWTAWRRRYGLNR